MPAGRAEVGPLLARQVHLLLEYCEAAARAGELVASKSLGVVDLSAADANGSWCPSTGGVKPDHSLQCCAFFKHAERHVSPVHELKRRPPVMRESLLVSGCEFAVEPAKDTGAGLNGVV